MPHRPATLEAIAFETTSLSDLRMPGAQENFGSEEAILVWRNLAV